MVIKCLVRGQCCRHDGFVIFSQLFRHGFGRTKSFTLVYVGIPMWPPRSVDILSFQGANSSSPPSALSPMPDKAWPYFGQGSPASRRNRPPLSVCCRVAIAGIGLHSSMSPISFGKMVSMTLVKLCTTLRGCRIQNK